MSYDQLMQHAEEIRDTAVKKYAEQIVQHSGGGGGPNLYGEAEKWGKQLFGDLPQVFHPYTEIPRPTSFDPMINAMGPVLDRLSTGEAADDPIKHVSYPANPNLTKVPGVTTAIDDWTGEAASDFLRFFVAPFPAIAKNQFIIARVVAAALDAEKALWSKTQEDIDQIAHKSLEALDKMDDCGKNEWNVAFTVGAALAALAGVAIAAEGANYYWAPPSSPRPWQLPPSPTAESQRSLTSPRCARASRI